MSRFTRPSTACALASCAAQPLRREPAPGPAARCSVFLSHFQRNDAITLYGDASTRRDFIHVEDVAHAILEVTPRPGAPLVVNVGTGRGTSLSELLALIESITGRCVPIEQAPARPFDVRDNYLDVSRLQQLTGISPLALEDGITRVWECFLQRERAEAREQCSSGAQA